MEDKSLKKFPITAAIFVFSCLFVVAQYFVFPKSEKMEEDKSSTYNYQLDMWSYELNVRNREILNKVSSGEISICADSVPEDAAEFTKYRNYFYEMRDFSLISKSQFHVSAYILKDLESMVEYVDSNFVNKAMSLLYISAEKRDEYKKHLKSYGSVIADSRKQLNKVNAITSEMDKMYFYPLPKFKETYFDICNSHTPFLNDKSFESIEKLTNTSYEMLEMYEDIHEGYSELLILQNYVRLACLLFLFILAQWFILRKDTEY
ncbi:hypothetical protein ATG66_3069 [Vibrio sp. ES.051]|uniref:hypothetical protein n=1 Tax=Vibrio sp. ES.051 TaxID=1761909 RepID=UPI000BF7E6B8|nr:hypothetical protein [Vibrio sp. ES.051]PFG45978.1 hypothetical protein ATG66_3069 [Vibrio sp. ES.051]